MFRIAARPFFASSRQLTPLIRRRKPKLPVISTNLTPQSVEEAVDNLLYSVPETDKTPSTLHTLNCLVSNEPGVLSRVSGVLAGRGINIESLVVGKFVLQASTEVPDLSRMTIVINGRDEKIEQARRQLEDIVAVWAVLDYTHTRAVYREMILVKVACVPHEFEDSDETVMMDRNAEQPHAVPSLLNSSLQRQSICELSKLFGAEVVDVTLDSVIVQLTAKSSRVDAFVELLKPYGILEAARSGTMAMPRSTVGQLPKEAEEEHEAFDATMLPPG